MRREAQALIVVVALTASVGACAARPGARVTDHQPPESLIHERPEISWMLSSESQGGTERLVCRSDAPDPCVLTVPLDRKPLLTTVHLVLHPTQADTRYTGIMRVGFGGTASDTKVDSTVVRGGPAGNISVTSLLTLTPGTYTTEISLSAASKGSSAPVSLRDTITLTIQ